MHNLGKNDCRVCMEWQEHCYWSHMADEEKHFFKAMTRDFTESISIPSRFASNFNGHISELVTLKSPSGKSWNIGVGSDNNERVTFRSGWTEFVGAHGVEEGDYLLFRYTGVSAFDVLIFDSSGCEKIPSRFFSIDNNARVGGGALRQRCHNKFHTECRPMQSSVPSDGDDDDDDVDDDALRKNTSWNWKISQKASKRNLSSNVLDCDEDDLDEVDEDRHHVPSKTTTGYYFCKNGPVSEYHLTEEEKEKISSIRVPVQSRKNPVFVQVMHPSHVRAKKSGVVGLSSEYATQFIGTLRREIILQRASSSSRGKWYAKYACSRYSCGLHGHGWGSFVEDNGILEHDVCLFELMQGTRRPTMTVHVLRRVRRRFVLLR